MPCARILPGERGKGLYGWVGWIGMLAEGSAASRRACLGCWLLNLDLNVLTALPTLSPPPHSTFLMLPDLLAYPPCICSSSARWASKQTSLTSWSAPQVRGGLKGLACFACNACSSAVFSPSGLSLHASMRCFSPRPPLPCSLLGQPSNFH